MSKPRSPRLAAHLATRERPGEVTIALWFLGFLGAQGLAQSALAVVWVASRGFPPATLLYLLFPAWMGACFLGLWRGTRWGWRLSVFTLGLFTVVYALGAVLSVIEGRNEMRFFNSLAGLIAMSAIALLAGAPLLLLVKARRRYEAWAASGSGFRSPGLRHAGAASASAAKAGSGP